MLKACCERPGRGSASDGHKVTRDRQGPGEARAQALQSVSLVGRYNEVRVQPGERGYHWRHRREPD